MVQSRIGLSAGPESTIISALSDVTTSVGHSYDLKDNMGFQMACVHIEAITDASVQSAVQSDTYFAFSQSMVGSEFQVRLATSKDLLNWTFRRTLVKNADMPYLSRVKGSDWLILAHEQWMNKKSTNPSRLGFKLYYNESELLQGSYFNTYIAPLTVGKSSTLEGTPNFYSANITTGAHGLLMVNADVGFHFNDENGVDQVAQGQLLSFGPTVVNPQFVNTKRSDAYDQLFISKGAIGNIGQRAPGMLYNTHISLQEANIGKMPPTIWADWRIWVYWFNENSEGLVPEGKGNVLQLEIKTHAGSTAFGNPAWHIVPCPSNNGQAFANMQSKECLFVSYFLFGEGAAPGEAGVAAFYKELSSLDTDQHILIH
jgi:hypothetical protein